MTFKITLLLFIVFQFWSSWAEDTTLELKNYLKMVESQSPDLLIEKSLNNEAKARASGIRINPPMIGFMNMKDGGSNNQGIEVSQEIPFPTKIIKDKEFRDLEAQSQKENLRYRKNEIMLQARLAYFDFWKAYERLQISKEKRDWLKRHAKIARTATRSDSTAQVHLLGIESEVDVLENEVLENESLLIEKRNALKIFAPELNELEVLPQKPKLESIEIDQNMKSSLIAWKESELKSAEASKDLKKQAYVPDIFLRYRGFNGNESTPKSEEIMVGVTIPFLFFWQPKAESNEASARLHRAEAEFRKVKIDRETKLLSLAQKLESQKKQLSALEEKLIPRSHKRMKLVETLSTRTMEGLDEHRTVMLDYLELRTKSINLRSEYEMSLTEILKLIDQKELP